MSRVDALAVLDSQIAEMRASGDTGNVENLLEARDAFSALLREAAKIESSIHAFGMTCTEFSECIARCGATP